ncbi:hypothetical protein FZEAL_2462 [Fusarium zealandicum]|uniref:Uncharacterized protein n=1 Tax=Fusarium zealandicum TaxID=1053134 RepID=A0A8H4URE1_9HYPO|nr:hypothetical protein FZEAL_2462 [Fusarium zealandicum]
MQKNVSASSRDSGQTLTSMGPSFVEGTRVLFGSNTLVFKEPDHLTMFCDFKLTYRYPMRSVSLDVEIQKVEPFLHLHNDLYNTFAELQGPIKVQLRIIRGITGDATDPASQGKCSAALKMVQRILDNEAIRLHLLMPQGLEMSVMLLEGHDRFSFTTCDTMVEPLRIRSRR